MQVLAQALLQRIAWRMQETEGGLTTNVISGESLIEEIEGYLSSDRWEMAPKEYHPLARAMVDPRVRDGLRGALP